eukprot:5802027-Pleurochrysis_carterae.AAC.1
MVVRLEVVLVVAVMSAAMRVVVRVVMIKAWTVQQLSRAEGLRERARGKQQVLTRQTAQSHLGSAAELVVARGVGGMLVSICMRTAV